MGRVRTWWHFTGTNIGEVDEWQTMKGVETSGRWPARYTHAGILRTDRQQLIRQINSDPARLRAAAAYLIGRHVMAAVVPDIGEPQESDRWPQEPDNLDVALRVGRGDMRCTIGVYNVDAHTFRAADDAVELVQDSTPINEVMSAYPNAHWL